MAGPGAMTPMEALQAATKPLFFATFKQAVALYVSGDWGTAKAKLEACLATNPDDGPSKSLLNVMARSQFKAPSEWKGFRALTSK